MDRRWRRIAAAAAASIIDVEVAWTEEMPAKKSDRARENDDGEFSAAGRPVLAVVKELVLPCKLLLQQ